MLWLILIPTAIVLCAGSLLSYSGDFKTRWWFNPLMIFLFVLAGLLWSWAVRLASDNKQLFVFSVAGDAITIFAYSILPILLFGVKLTVWGWVGFGLVLCGTLILKTCG